jgi:TonB family protein
VKRQCWENALATRPPGAPSSARVVVTMSVAPDGHVQNVTASDAAGYPGLSSCVQGQVRNWKFPASDGSTVTVPFVFAAQ